MREEPDEELWDRVFDGEDAAFLKALEEEVGLRTKSTVSEAILTGELLKSTISSQGLSGALDPISKAAGKHAEQYYESVRKMTTDVEDCKEPIRICVDMDGNGESVEMPRGYEWCDNHIKHAERYLLERYEQGTLKNEMMLMWG